MSIIDRNIRIQALKYLRMRLREQLREVEDQLDQIAFGDVLETEKPQQSEAAFPTWSVLKRERAARNLTANILLLLIQNNAAALSPAEIADLLHEEKRIASIRSTLIRLRNEGRIDQPEPGKYMIKPAEDAGAKDFSREHTPAENPTERKP